MREWKNLRRPLSEWWATRTTRALIALPIRCLIRPIAQVTDAYTASYSNGQPLLWVVRTRDDPHGAVSLITEQLRLASGGFPVAHVRTMEEVMGHSTDRENFNMLLLTIFGVVALVLAAIGIYGLMAYTVTQRNQEMGIRMALGADRSAIRRLVVWSGMRLAIAGIALGMIAAFGLTRLLSSILFAVRPLGSDRLSIRAAQSFRLVALLAVWLPRNACLQNRPGGGPAHGVIGAFGLYPRHNRRVGIRKRIYTSRQQNDRL